MAKFRKSGKKNKIKKKSMLRACASRAKKHGLLRKKLTKRKEIQKLQKHKKFEKAPQEKNHVKSLRFAS